ncbi:MAG TPA: hypothetical protein VER12_18750 [Polyangiaceae bacterium]|nr:hypothetical protein [Polyangiaceae bacterium]
MLWVALATAIMLLSGELSREADDGAILSALIAALRKATMQEVPDPPRRAAALRALSTFEAGLSAYRRQLVTFKACIAAADAQYGATQADYDVCSGPLESERASLRTSLLNAQSEYETAVSADERTRVAHAVLALPEAKLLDAARAGHEKSSSPSRSRGVEGVVTERHVTLPRNVVSVVYGPLSSATFGQRFPSRIIDGGTSYAHLNQSLADATGAEPDLWHMRGGARVGMFDDFEAGALFMPLQLGPKFHYDPVLIFFTQQLRFQSVDLAIRASFETPGDTGWGINPGLLLARPGRSMAARLGVFLPMEVGTLRQKIAPIVGLNVPLRLTWSLIPSVFVSLDSGLAYDHLARQGELELPLGLGAGYSLLAGSKLIDITASFTWDHFLVPAPAQGEARVEWQAYRIAFGASLYFQAL